MDSTKSQRREAAISALWRKFSDGRNPFALIAIQHLQEQREVRDGWLYEDELPDGYDYDGNFERSEIRDGVRMFPANNPRPSHFAAGE